MTLSSRRADVPTAALRAAIAGTVAMPGEPGYEEGTRVLYGRADRRPVAVVRVADGGDVAPVIAFAREHGLELGVRAGGHSLQAFGVADGGIVLDLSGLKSIEIDREARTVWAGGGVTAGELTKALAEHELAVPFGDTGSVGIGGITLGGGVGYLVRKYGMTIDSLLAAEVVTADGDTLLASSDSHPELFWALRGGGGNFGVVTRFQFRLRSVRGALGGMLVLPATPETVKGVVAAAVAAPEALSAIVNVMPAPPMPFLPPDAVGKPIVMVVLAHITGDDAGESGDAEAAAVRAVAPFRSVGTPLADMVRPIKYVELFGPEQAGPPAIIAAENLFADAIGPSEASAIVAAAATPNPFAPPGFPGRAIQLRVLGGAMARVPADATAYAHRSAPIMVQVVSFHDGSPDGEAEAGQWVGAIAGKLRGSDRGAYVNFLQRQGPDALRDAYPEATLERLRAAKRRYDPDNVFHRNQTIPPED